jgi:hypothetical protein
LILQGSVLARNLLCGAGRVVARATEPFMSIQPVSSYPQAPDASASRRRVEGGEGEVFALPGQQGGNAAEAGKDAGGKATDKTVALAEAAAGAASGEAGTVAATAKGKDAPVVKTGDVPAKPVASRQDAAQPQGVSPVVGVDFLIAMAAAQMEAAAAQGGEGTPRADGETKPAEGERKPAEAGAGEAVAEGSPMPAADRIVIAVPEAHPLAMPALPLPAATPNTGDEAAAAPASGRAIAVGDEAKAQAMPSPLLGLAATGANPAKAAEAASAGEAMAMVDGKGALDAGHGAGSRGAEEKPVVGAASKTDATAPAAIPAAADPKQLDSLQQALGPLDLSAMLQHAQPKPGHDRPLQPLDPGLMPNGAAAAPGQGVAGGPATPIHVVPIEIGLRAMAGSRQFDIRLDPDELGRVDVNLSISDEGEVSARLVVDRVETLHLLQRDSRTLERAFEQAGLKPSDGGVDISLRDPSDQSAFRQNRQQDEAPQRPRPARDADPAENAPLSIDPAPQRRLVRLGGVDLSI